jgi:hypothetical protein
VANNYWKVSVQSFFETQLTLANTASLGATASAGIAGSYGTSKRLFAANGLEPQQVLKGMVPAFMDQIVNNYLSKTN